MSHSLRTQHRHYYYYFLLRNVLFLASLWCVVLECCCVWSGVCVQVQERVFFSYFCPYRSPVLRTSLHWQGLFVKPGSSSNCMQIQLRGGRRFGFFSGGHNTVFFFVGGEGLTNQQREREGEIERKGARTLRGSAHVRNAPFLRMPTKKLFFLVSSYIFGRHVCMILGRKCVHLRNSL